MDRMVFKLDNEKNEFIFILAFKKTTEQILCRAKS